MEKKYHVSSFVVMKMQTIFLRGNLLLFSGMLRLVSPLLIIICASCGSLRNSHKYELGNGDYLFKEHGGSYQRVNVYVNDDTVSIITRDKREAIVPSTFRQVLIKASPDLDIMTVPFKYRPGNEQLPRQLTTDFNGNVFFGVRFDRFVLQRFQTPIGDQQIRRHRAITVGAFGGIGATQVTPWTTFYRTIDEYNALVITRGLALMVGFNNLTVGAGIGWDRLTDRDKDIWIYQNKPWYGLTFGLNLN